MGKSVFQSMASVLATGCWLVGLNIGLAAPSVRAQDRSITAQAVEIDCTHYDRPEWIVEKFVRDTILHRGWQFARAGEMTLAAHTLRRAIEIAQPTTDPMLRAELVSHIAGKQGGQPGIFEQILSDGLARQQLEVPLGLLPKIEAVTQPLADLYPALFTKTDVLTYLAEVYLRLEQPELAGPLLEHAWQTADFAEGGAFAIRVVPIAEGYLALGETEQALAVLAAAWQAANTVDQPDASYQTQILEPLAIAYLHAEQPETALQIAASLQAADANARVLASVAADYRQAGQLVKAETLFEQATAAARGADQAEVALGEVAQRYGPAEAALNLASTLADPEIKANTLAALAARYHQQGRPEQAATLLIQAVNAFQGIPFHEEPERLLIDWTQQFAAAGQSALIVTLAKTPGIDEFMYLPRLLEKIANAAVTAGAHNAAWQIADMIAPEEAQGYYRNAALQRVAVGYAHSGEIDTAQQIIQTMGLCGEQVCQASALIAVAERVARSGQPQQALTLLDQAHAIAQADGQSEHNQSVWIDLATQYALLFASLGQLDQATDWHDRLLDRLNALGYHAALNIQGRTIGDFLEAGQPDLAIRTVEQLEDSALHDAGWHELVLQLLTQGETERARALIDNINSPDVQVRLYVALADDAIGIGEPERAALLLSPAVEIAKTLPNVESEFANEWDQTNSLSAISIRYAALGQSTHTAETVSLIADESVRAALLQRLKCYQP